MSWTQTKVSGSGTLAYRLCVEGWPYQWVTSETMEDAAATPPKIGGLAITGKLKCVANIASGELDVSGFSVQIADTGERTTLALAKNPTARTSLTVELAAGGTTATVRSTAGFAASGTIWIDSEAMTYSGVTATTFTGLTRGALGTLDQKHFIAMGGNLRYPEVTNLPVTMAGRRARLYVYGREDSATGAGTQLWLGIVSRHPTHQGARWRMSVDPITSVLARALSGDLDVPATPRGIYYPWNRPFYLVINIATAGDAVPGDAASTVRIAFPLVAGDTAFFETQADFVIYLRAKIATATSGWDTAIGVEADGEDGYHFTATTDATPTAVWFEGPGGVDPIFGEALDDDGAEVFTFLASRQYTFRGRADSLMGAGSVPRGYYGDPPPPGPAAFVNPALRATFPSRRLYIGGSTALSALTTAADIEWPTFGSWPSGHDSAGVTTIYAADRYIECERTPLTLATTGSQPFFHAFAGSVGPVIRFGRTYTESGSVWTMLLAILTAGADEINAGAVPDLRADDFDTTAWEELDASWQSRITRERVFRSFTEVLVGDIVREELKLAGYVMGLDSVGRMSPFRLRRPVATEAGTVAISSFVVERSLPSWDPTGVGLVNTVIVRRGYDALEDEYTGATDKVRDVAAYGQSPRPRAIKIEPKSVPAGAPETHAELVELASRIFAVLAYPYAIVQADVSFQQWATVTGSIVSATTPHLPDPATGALNVTALPMLVTGREIDLAKGIIAMTMLAHLGRASGYAPEAVIASEIDNGANSWTLTLDTYTFPAGTEADDWLDVGDEVRVWRWDSTTAGTVVGAVTAASGNAVTVLFDASAAALSSDTWVLGYDVSTACDQGQLAYAYMAGSTGRIDGPADIDAFGFA